MVGQRSAHGDLATDTKNLYGRASANFQPTGRVVSHQLTLRYFDSDNRNLIDQVEDSGSASDRITFGYQADVKLGDNVLSLALEHEKTEFEQTGAVVFGDPNQKQKMDVDSVVVEYQGLSLDRLSWIVSARFDDNSDFDLFIIITNLLYQKPIPAGS